MNKTYTASNDHGTVSLIIKDKTAKVDVSGAFEDWDEVAALIEECIAQYQPDHPEVADAHPEAE